MSNDDSHLIQRAKEGHADAFTEIYRRYQPSVYRYVYYRVGSEVLAEEVTAEVFARLVSKFHTFADQGRPILAWLYTIARNLAIDHVRHNNRITWLPLDETMETEEGSDPVPLAERHLTHAALAAAMMQLTEGQRQVIWLKFMEGLSNAETAAVLGKDEGAVKSLQHRALAALRRVLGEEEFYGY